MMHAFASILTATTLVVGAAAADDKQKSANADATFNSLDKNADERLTISEVAGDKMLTEQFAAADWNRDGQLTKREYTEHMKDRNKPSR